MVKCALPSWRDFPIRPSVSSFWRFSAIRVDWHAPCRPLGIGSRMVRTSQRSGISYDVTSVRNHPALGYLVRRCCPPHRDARCCFGTFGQDRLIGAEALSPLYHFSRRDWSAQPPTSVLLRTLLAFINRCAAAQAFGVAREQTLPDHLYAVRVAPVRPTQQRLPPDRDASACLPGCVPARQLPARQMLSERNFLGWECRTR